MVTQATVLIVDESDDSREVLRTALRRKGVHTVEARYAADGLVKARQSRPNVIVLDLEFETDDSDEICRRFITHSGESDASLVLIGSARLETTDLPDPSGRHRNQVVSKPYHYNALIRRIEELLA